MYVYKAYSTNGNENRSKRPFVDDTYLSQIAPRVNMKDTSWLHGLDHSLGFSKQISADQLRKLFMGSLTKNTVDGPHQITMLEIAGPGLHSPTTLVVLVGEIHGNPDGCRSASIPTIFGILSDILRQTSNTFLILESFFHLIPHNAASLERLSRGLQTRAENNEHSIWNACECISSNATRCSVNKKSVGQLILFRAFSFIVQFTTVYLDLQGIHNTNFHLLNDRIYHMDPREDANLRPYDWLEKPQEERIPEMLRRSIPIIMSFTPKLESDDLRNWYTDLVQKPILEKIHKCINEPCKDLYEEVFTTVTEIVTMSVFFYIVETFESINPHILMVVGDSHRKLIVKFLKDCLGKKVLSEKTYRSLDGKMSCPNF